MTSILDLFKRLYVSCLKSYKAENRVKLIIPKSITGTYFDTKLSRFGLAGLPVAAILDFVKRLYISCSKSYQAEN